MMSVFTIQHLIKTDDGIGGVNQEWETFITVNGYIDMLSGTDLNNIQNSFMEQSTHVLIIPSYTDGIKDTMRVIDKDNRKYTITYSDNPVNQNHHNEIYLTFGGVLNE